MILRCNCDHKRVEHIGGDEYVSNRRVLKCTHANCTCKHYTADKETRQFVNGLYMQALVFPLVVIILAFGTVAGSWYLTDEYLDSYVIEQKIVTKTFWANGTEIVSESETDPKESVAGFFKMGAALAAFIVVYFTCALYPLTKVENMIKELLKKQND